MSDRQNSQRLGHLGMATGEEPRDDGAPVMTGDMGAVSPECLDETGDVRDELVDLVIADVGRRVAQSVAPHVWRDRQRSGPGERVYLPRPGLGAFWKTVEQDGQLA